MEVLYWQIVVAGTIVAAYTLGSIRWGLAAAVIWTIWTILKIGYGPLIFLQLLSAWGTFLLVDSLTEQSRKLKEFEKALKGHKAKDREAFSRAQEQGKVCPLTDSDHFTYLINSIESAESSVLILSGWISARVLNNRLIEAMSGALQRRVEIYIGFGYQDSGGTHDLSWSAKRALRSLLRLRSKHPNLYVGEFNNHQKVLVIDSKKVVCGSHNWLSNKAFINRERSFIIDDEEAARSVFADCTTLIQNHRVEAV